MFSQVMSCMYALSAVYSLVYSTSFIGSHRVFEISILTILISIFCSATCCHYILGLVITHTRIANKLIAFHSVVVA